MRLVCVTLRLLTDAGFAYTLLSYRGSDTWRALSAAKLAKDAQARASSTNASEDCRSPLNTLARATPTNINVATPSASAQNQARDIVSTVTAHKTNTMSLRSPRARPKCMVDPPCGVTAMPNANLGEVFPSPAKTVTFSTVRRATVSVHRWLPAPCRTTHRS